MRNVKLILEYNGGSFHGFVRQPKLKTIEEALLKATQKVLGEKVKIVVAGRTDAGVHALNQVVNFKTKSKIPAEKLQLALARYLPEDIVVKKAVDVDLNFDARKNAKSRMYRYLIVNGGYVPLKFKDYAWHIKSKLNIENMRKAVKQFVGKKNFKSFCKLESGVKSFVRRIYSFRFKVIYEKFEEGIKILQFDIKGNAFLHNMVRIIIGTIVDVGKGKIAPNDIKEIFKKKNRVYAGLTAPAKGLTLLNIEY